MSELELAVLSPMWQRIARGEIDLSQYTDKEIMSGRITMADGRLLPKPKVFPDLFVKEQVRRGFIVAERKIRKGAMKSLDVALDILEDDTAPPKDRMTAVKFFADRFLGPPEQRLHVTHEGKDDPRDLLIQRLLAAKQQPVLEGEIVEAEIVDPLLEEIL